MSDIRYFNFPVVLLQDFMTDSIGCLKKNLVLFAVFPFSSAWPAL